MNNALCVVTKQLKAPFKNGEKKQLNISVSKFSLEMARKRLLSLKEAHGYQTDCGPDATLMPSSKMDSVLSLTPPWDIWDISLSEEGGGGGH